MKVVNCVWELQNLGERVVEITVESDDVFNRDEILRSSVGYEYVVIKVPMNKVDFNFGLSSLGYSMIETQINISKKYKDFPFDDRLVKQVYPLAEMQIIHSGVELEDSLVRMTPDMFSTDRIYLDPYFARDSSCRRYGNWIRTEFEKKTAVAIKMIYDGVEVGVGTYRVLDNGIYVGLVGGIYEEYQDNGLGLMTACLNFIAAKKYGTPFRAFKTSISSNNLPMLQLYNYLNYKVDNMSYVFVKHI